MRGDREDRTGDGGSVRGDRGWRECETGQGMEGVLEWTGDGGNVRGDREDRGQGGHGMEGT